MCMFHCSCCQLCLTILNVGIKTFFPCSSSDFVATILEAHMYIFCSLLKLFKNAFYHSNPVKYVFILQLPLWNKGKLAKSSKQSSASGTWMVSEICKACIPTHIAIKDCCLIFQLCFTLIFPPASCFLVLLWSAFG